jgi:hypothetical protein
LACDFATEADGAANSAVVSGAIAGFDPIDNLDGVRDFNSVLDFESIAGCDSGAGCAGCAGGMPTSLDAICIWGRADSLRHHIRELATTSTPAPIDIPQTSRGIRRRGAA